MTPKPKPTTKAAKPAGRRTVSSTKATQGAKPAKKLTSQEKARQAQIEFEEFTHRILDFVLRCTMGTTVALAKEFALREGLGGSSAIQPSSNALYVKVYRTFKSLEQRGLIEQRGNIWFPVPEAIEADQERAAMRSLRTLMEISPEFSEDPMLRAALQGTGEKGKKPPKVSFLERLLNLRG